MAQIKIEEFERIEKNRNTVHDSIYATYTVFEQSGGVICRLIHMGSLGVKILTKLANLFR